jgi:fructosamine-3-kinase
MKELLQQITSSHDLQLQGSESLSGGDINAVFRLNCTVVDYVIKLNSASRFPQMFEAEAAGLKLLKKSDSFRVPKVLATGEIEDTAYLILEYIPSGSPGSNFWSDFAQDLAKLHRHTGEAFGLVHSNYIGSLPQQNHFT